MLYTGRKGTTKLTFATLTAFSSSRRPIRPNAVTTGV